MLMRARFARSGSTVLGVRLTRSEYRARFVRAFRFEKLARVSFARVSFARVSFRSRFVSILEMDLKIARAFRFGVRRTPNSRAV